MKTSFQYYFCSSNGHSANGAQHSDNGFAVADLMNDNSNQQRLSEADRHIVRLIGQHLTSLGMRYDLIDVLYIYAHLALYL
jgi:hypothetical protein